jgi:hypothetical protein
MRLYAAFDLHSSNSYLGIVNENGKRTFKRRLRNEPEMIREVTSTPCSPCIDLRGQRSSD